MEFVEVKGVRVPALGFGTWELRGAACTRIVRFALDLGYRHIDTAQIYENEEEVGTAIAQSGVARDDIFLTTKIWFENLARAQLGRSFAESLRKLKTDYVDLLLIHWPSQNVPMAESLFEMAELKAKGFVRHIGVSNFTVALLKEAVERHGTDLLCNQVEYHPLLSQHHVLGYLRAKGMMLTAYSPLAQGKFDILGDSRIVEIGRCHGKTPAQVILRWLVQQPGVSAIPKTGKENHCRVNFEIFDFKLSQQEMETVGGFKDRHRAVDPSWSPKWDAA